jgi:hypothetical protein
MTIGDAALQYSHRIRLKVRNIALTIFAVSDSAIDSGRLLTRIANVLAGEPER